MDLPPLTHEHREQPSRKPGLTESATGVIVVRDPPADKPDSTWRDL